MCKIGVNISGYVNQDLFIGKEIANTGKGKEAQEKALKIARVNEGSELVYKGTDDAWHIKELKEEGVVIGDDPISITDKNNLLLNPDLLKSSGIKEQIYSFVEMTADEATKNEIAKDPNINPEILARLAADDTESLNKPSVLQLAVARNPNSSIETLKELINKTDYVEVYAAAVVAFMFKSGGNELSIDHVPSEFDKTALKNLLVKEGQIYGQYFQIGDF